MLRSQRNRFTVPQAVLLAKLTYIFDLMTAILSSLCQLYDLGPLLETKKLSGSVFNTLWHIRTAKGRFVIKQWQGPLSIVESLYHSQKIALEFLKAGLPVVTALKLADKSIYRLNGGHYMVFPFSEGNTLTRDIIEAEHISSIGTLLAKMHQADIHYQDSPAIETYSLSEHDLKKYSYPWLLALHSRCQEACNQTPSDSIISHRDLTLNNIIWQNHQPHIIDWDWAGQISRTQDVLATALNFSLTGSATVNLDRFKYFLKCYLLPLTPHEIEAGFYRVLANWLNWIVLNPDIPHNQSEYSLLAAKHIYQNLPQLLELT